ncbi:hypothetical protein [Candidatus Magnetaquicoccus inordinatus]|uniref:hypothetical protein n=1 Tax=Candidatus Magnetaquicoccus inordinatus TaxID=2496818 RepID=UPI00102CA159|nr:hypothetical protein [Candidatus Magnetaquicoccus inordinatus]
MTTIQLSTLAHTWLIDIDGTLFRHNGHLQGEDELLPGVLDFWKQIPDQDVIMLLSARTEEQKAATLAALSHHGLRFDYAMFALPVGERILINDSKPSGLQTAIAVNPQRDVGMAQWKVQFDEHL